MNDKPNLLLIEDDKAVCEAVTRVLEAEDFHVTTATTSTEALRQFNEGSIDVVLLDLSLGSEQGWDIFNALKQIDPSLPIIVTSARADELAQSSVPSADAVLEKPFDIPFLVTLLKQLSSPESIVTVPAEPVFDVEK